MEIPLTESTRPFSHKSLASSMEAGTIKFLILQMMEGPLVQGLKETSLGVRVGFN